MAPSRTVEEQVKDESDKRNNFLSGFVMFAEKKQAFSLIELLIVISLVALLMAILLPSPASSSQSSVGTERSSRGLRAAHAQEQLDNLTYSTYTW